MSKPGHWKTIKTDLIQLPIEEKHLELTEDGVTVTPEVKKLKWQKWEKEPKQRFSPHERKKKKRK